MACPFALMKSVGVRAELLPFFKCMCVYFMWRGVGMGPTGDQEEGVVVVPMSIVGVVAMICAKCSPVICLLVLIVMHHATLDYNKGRYARRVAAGLALSAAGDALLLWPQHFVAGMGAFAGAHVAYLAAFGLRPLRPALGGASYAAAAAYCALLSPPAGLRALVPLYSALLATMAWRGAARGGSAAAGALLFLVSDAILGYSLFAGPVPYSQVLVMSSYYLAQLGIALSALRHPEPE